MLLVRPAKAHFAPVTGEPPIMFAIMKMIMAMKIVRAVDQSDRRSMVVEEVVILSQRCM